MFYSGPAFLALFILNGLKMHNGVSMFNNSEVNIGGSVRVTVHVDTPRVPDSNVDRLIDEVASNAILNAGGRADEVRCYPGTREEVIGKIEKWVDGHSELCHRIIWLSGPAGAGKSAIAQTVAERCKEHGIHSANFFFFRGDGTRNHVQPLVATLVYQLFDYYRPLKAGIAELLVAKPLICKASIAEQFKRLLSYPLQAIQHTLSQPIILIIDGLDECDDERNQEQILVALHALVENDDSPFRVMVASREEHHLKMTFNKFGASVKSLFLNGEYRPQDDIRRFVIAKFDEIRRVHSLAHTLSLRWPTKADIDAITDKSSGQFIYAATVMRYIQYSTASPALSLLTVYGMRPSADHSAYAQLDAVYSHIFSKAHNIWAVRLILCAHFVMESTFAKGDFRNLALLLEYDMDEIKSIFADLAAIIQVADGLHLKLVFYHASLSDYLTDKSRSGIYHVNVGEIASELSLICLKKLHVENSLAVVIWVLIRVEEVTPELSKSLLDVSTRQFNGNFMSKNDWRRLTGTIERFYFEADKALFKSMLRSWVRFAYINDVDTRGCSDALSPSAFRYYKWYQAIERVRFAFRPSR